MRAVDLAHELGIDPKRLRQWLRDHFVHEHNAAWDLTSEQEAQVRARFGGSQRTQPIRATGGPAQAGRVAGRGDSDEAYVIDLCNEALGEEAFRQHRFPWLLGDPGRSGAGVQLPVDAYYPNHELVIEYRERQHYEATPFFDRRQTVSGVGRGEQRREYDARREEELPRHGVRLVIVRSTDLQCDRRGRLLRDRPRDVASLRRLLQGEA